MSASDDKCEDSASGGLDTASGGTDCSLTTCLTNKVFKRYPYFIDTKGQGEIELLEAEHAIGMKNDFADLLSVPSDCNYFKFKSEKEWDKEADQSSFSCQKFFNLDLEVLSHGLKCVPFYEMVEMEKSVLPTSDVEKCDAIANVAQEIYKDVRENFLKEMRDNEQFSQSFEDLTGIKWEPRPIVPRVIESRLSDDSDEEELEPQVSHNRTFWISHRTELKEIGDDSYLAASSSNESLEIWLDTVLDD